MFKPKKQKKSVAPPVSPAVAEKIHVMPERFYLEKKEKETSRFFLWLAVILAIAGIGIAGFILISSYLKTPPPAAPAEAEPVEPEAVAAPTEPVANKNINVSPPPVEPPAEPEPPPPAAPVGTKDEDNDGLTLNEEKLYLTNSLNPDTDNDGYPDGQEILNGYDPRQPGKTLIESGRIKIYENSRQNYALNQPQDWLVNSLDAQNQEVVFDTKLGEFIRIVAKPNPEQLSLNDWIAANDLLTEISQLTPVTINNLSGLKTADGLKYYLAKPDLTMIYIISYEAVGLTEVSFKTTFTMMTRSFRLENPL